MLPRYRGSPELVRLDMMLPKLSGLEVLEVLKQNPNTQHIPLVVLTSLHKGTNPDFYKRELLPI